jgi:hypothetical protein
MRRVNINDFMARFHTVERELKLFDDMAEDGLWWDSVRFDACYFLFDCLTGLQYSSAHMARPQTRRLGTLRRWAERQLLLAAARASPKDLLVLRAPRNTVAGHGRDAVLDPIVELLPARTRTVDTYPRRYHLPDFDASKWPETIPQSLPRIIETLLDAFGIDPARGVQLEALIRRGRAEFNAQAAGYRRLLATARPRAVLLVGVEKALFHVSKMYGVPTIEAQHGLIGYGHPAYSYPPELDYSRQTTLPDMFLTFSGFWQTNGFYPVRRREVIGTDHFGNGVPPLDEALGGVMVIAANIYHDELLALTRQVAAQLPARKFIYKLHPNQTADAATIRDAVADLPNIEVGDPGIAAPQLMADISHLIAIQSTVVYEALQQGRRVSILPRHDYHIHSDVFDLPAVTVPATLDELVASLGVPGARAEAQRFFDPFNAARAFELVAELTDTGAARSRRT